MYEVLVQIRKGENMYGSTITGKVRSLTYHHPTSNPPTIHHHKFQPFPHIGLQRCSLCRTFYFIALSGTQNKVLYCTVLYCRRFDGWGM